MPLHSAVFQQMADKIWSFHDMHPDVKVCALEIELFSTHKLREVPQNAAAYANRGEYYDAITVFGWTSKLCAQVRHANGHEYVGRGGMARKNSRWDVISIWKRSC